MSEFNRERIANKCFVRGVFLGLVAAELDVTREPADIKAILKAIRKLKNKK